MIKGVVIKSTGSWYKVKSEEGEFFDCRIVGKFRLKGIKTTNPLAVGDWVMFEIDTDENGVIKDILPRRNYIIRKSVNLSKRAHIIASNIDQALLVVTLTNPPTSLGFVDRFLVSAEAFHIPVTIVFNKVDLYDDQENAALKDWISLYEGIGYKCITSSATQNINLDVLKDEMKDKVTLFSGHSGVGKSTLINAISPNLDVRVGETSEHHKKGKHTTTFAEMFELDFGGYIVDTPGVKGFGVVEVEKEEISHYFLEMREALQECKFNDCQHINEPKCEVKRLLENGKIAQSRYKSYLSIYTNDDQETFRGLNQFE